MYMRAEKGWLNPLGKLFSWHYNGFLADARSHLILGCKKLSVHRCYFAFSSRPATLVNVSGYYFIFWNGFSFFLQKTMDWTSWGWGAPIRPSIIQVRSNARTFQRRVERIWQLVHRVLAESWLFSSSFFYFFFVYITTFPTLCVCIIFCSVRQKALKAIYASKHVVPGMFLSGWDMSSHGLEAPDDAYVSFALSLFKCLKMLEKMRVLKIRLEF